MDYLNYPLGQFRSDIIVELCRSKAQRGSTLANAVPALHRRGELA